MPKETGEFGPLHKFYFKKLSTEFYTRLRYWGPALGFTVLAGVSDSWVLVKALI